MTKGNEKLLRQFPALVAQLEGGALVEELTETMRNVVSEIADACLDQGGTQKGSLTLKLDFQMNQKDRFVEIKADIAHKLPKVPRGRAGIFFTDAEGNLTREDPRQLTLEDELARQREAKEERAAQMLQQN